MGSIADAQGNIFLSVFRFDTDGGLSAFLNTNGGHLWNGRDYDCLGVQCDEPTFILYNSTAQTLDVVASTSFGERRFTPPAPFSLAPGEATVRTFVSNRDEWTTRTETGSIDFSGQIGGVEVSRASHRARISVRGDDPETTLLAAVLPTSRAGTLNQALTTFVTYLNTGTEPAIGCYVWPAGLSRVKVIFQQTDAATNQLIGAPNTPFDIPPGEARSMLMAIASQEAHVAEIGFDSALVNFSCANGFAPANDANMFSVSTLGAEELADMISISATASGDGIVDVPAGGGAFSTATMNIGAASTVRARAQYVRPFEESDPQMQFTAFLCKTDPGTSACLQPPSAEVEFTADPNVPHTFSIFVQRPTVDPGFSPGERRVFVIFNQLAAVTNPTATRPVTVGSTSVAVRAQ